MRQARLLSAVALLGVTTSVASAQSNWAITPIGAYTAPSGNLVEGPFLNVEPNAGFVVGLIAELSLSKALALSASASSTVGLTSKTTFVFDPNGAPSEFEFANAWTQFNATAILRPMGRLPNGAPRGFWLEAGAGLTRFSLADVADRSGTGTSPTWNAMFPSAIVGGGFSLRMTPRLTAVIFGRYALALSEYESDGLDDWNSTCTPGDPACVDEGQKTNLLQIGIGIRAGR